MVELDDSNWEGFLTHPRALLVVGKKGCAACAEWSDELVREAGALTIPVGKVTLGGEGKLTHFKRVMGIWLQSLEGLPHNTLWEDGARVKEWSGGGYDRLVTRLHGLGWRNGE